MRFFLSECCSCSFPPFPFFLLFSLHFQSSHILWMKAWHHSENTFFTTSCLPCMCAHMCKCYDAKMKVTCLQPHSIIRLCFIANNVIEKHLLILMILMPFFLCIFDFCLSCIIFLFSFFRQLWGFPLMLLLINLISSMNSESLLNVVWFFSILSKRSFNHSVKS